MGNKMKMYTVYILKQVRGLMYVGHTGNFEKRMKDHFNGKGAQWTIKHPPIGIIRTLKVDNLEYAKYLERLWTVRLMDEYGYDRVRGSVWTRTV